MSENISANAAAAPALVAKRDDAVEIDDATQGALDDVAERTRVDDASSAATADERADEQPLPAATFGANAPPSAPTSGFSTPVRAQNATHSGSSGSSGSAKKRKSREAERLALSTSSFDGAYWSPSPGARRAAATRDATRRNGDEASDAEIDATAAVAAATTTTTTTTATTTTTTATTTPAMSAADATTKRRKRELADLLAVHFDGPYWQMAASDGGEGRRRRRSTTTTTTTTTLGDNEDDNDNDNDNNDADEEEEEREDELIARFEALDDVAEEDYEAVYSAERPLGVGNATLDGAYWNLIGESRSRAQRRVLTYDASHINTSSRKRAALTEEQRERAREASRVRAVANKAARDAERAADAARYLARVKFESAGRLVLPHLFVGGQIAANNVRWLESAAVGAVVNVTNRTFPYEATARARGAALHRVAVDDTVNDAPLLLSQLRAATEFVHAQRAAQRNCLVHCFQGRSRGPTVVIAYLVRFANFTLQQAVDHLDNVNKGTNAINDGFLRLLMQWERELRGVCTLQAYMR